MCLVVNHKATETLKNSGKKFIYCYKVVNRDFYSIHHSPYKYHAGFNEAQEEKVDIKVDEIYGGVLHVFLTKKKALNYACKAWRERIIPVRCYLKDLVAVGNHGDACFKRVYIEKHHLT